MGSKSRYVQFAWTPAAMQNARAFEDVLLIGSGLTSIDVMRALAANWE